MILREVRILPPFAIGRLGSASLPMDNFTVEDNPHHPLGFRQIRALKTLVVDEKTGKISGEQTAPEITFTTGEMTDKGARVHIRPVAPFLEIFAVVTDDGGAPSLRPLDAELIRQLKLGNSRMEWNVRVGNRKVERRTGDENDRVIAETGWFSDHASRRLEGHSNNFVANGSVDFGRVRFINPDGDYSQIRLRFTPAKGLIYGPAGVEDSAIAPELRVYDADKGNWAAFTADDAENETVPPSLYAIRPPAPSWLNDNIAASRGYLDDACDGFAEFRLTLEDGTEFLASARICAAPPAVVPDSMFVRTLADDLEQVIHGPAIPEDEPYEVTRWRAADIVRRAYETVRFMNVALMNGNNFKGRPSLTLDSMPQEESADTERAIHPVMAPTTVDTFSILALHQQVYTALLGGAAPWFVKLLRKPDEVADFTDRGRRKMPALMCGADNNYLALTHRQIDTIRKVASEALFQDEPVPIALEPQLDPLNLTAQLHYRAAGNPLSSTPATSVANCCPGLEVDFRAVWRRMFKGIVLREYDNLVVSVDPDVTDQRILSLEGQQLRVIKLPDGREFPTTTTMKGPAPSDPRGSITLTSQFNPLGEAALEWSNMLAFILSGYQGKTVTCEFSDGPIVELEVRHFFDGGTAVIAKELADAGELTQGLCSPWQNDYRECSCYYWASARPDYVNVEPAGNGLSKGDNWFQKERTGDYVPDDYQDGRLVLYDELFADWERWLRFQVGGRDVPAPKIEIDSTTPKSAKAAS